MNDDDAMAKALGLAREAAEAGEVPVGAVLLSSEGRVLAADRNRILEGKDPTAHAEMLVIRGGAASLGNERLIGTTLFVTLEPCTMCAGAIAMARIARVVFAAADPKGGAIVSGVRFYDQPTCHHRPVVENGPGAEEASKLLKDFFRTRRN